VDSGFFVVVLVGVFPVRVNLIKVVLLGGLIYSFHGGNV
jgi:hypothetical protein